MYMLWVWVDWAVKVACTYRPSAYRLVAFIASYFHCIWPVE